MLVKLCVLVVIGLLKENRRKVKLQHSYNASRLDTQGHPPIHWRQQGPAAAEHDMRNVRGNVPLTKVSDTKDREQVGVALAGNDAMPLIIILATG